MTDLRAATLEVRADHIRDMNLRRLSVLALCAVPDSSQSPGGLLLRRVAEKLSREAQHLYETGGDLAVNNASERIAYTTISVSATTRYATIADLDDGDLTLAMAPLDLPAHTAVSDVVGHVLICLVDRLVRGLLADAEEKYPL